MFPWLRARMQRGIVHLGGNMIRYLPVVAAAVASFVALMHAGQEPAVPASNGALSSGIAPANAAAAVLESRTQKWEFGISVRAVGGPCAGLLGTFPVPTDWPEQQVKLAGEQMSPTVQRHSYRAGDGLKQMVFEVPQLPAGSTAECFLTFEITKRAQVPPPDTVGLIVPKDPPRDVKKFLNPSPLIETTNAKVRSLARELPADKETA